MCWSATVETGVLFIERGVAYRKTGLDGILFISTVDYLHGLLFIHRRPPPASTCNCSSMGSCSSSLHRSSTGYCSTSPLHRVLFNHPSTGYCSSSPPPATVHPALHGVLFIQPPTGSYSSSPPWGPVHPALHGVLFIHPQPARSGSSSSSGNTTGHVHPTPPPGTVHPTPRPQTRLNVHPEAASIGFS